MQVNKILEWESTDGKRKALLVLNDPNKGHNDIDQQWLEVSSFDASNDKWETVEKIDYVEEVLDYGFPESLLD